jgi:16S rRNA (adenine1518-N6/adenine1519-N6)-dimethyltransferase
LRKSREMTSDSSAIPAQSGGASPDGLPPLRDVIRTHGLDAKKSLGQNFILDLTLTRAIARLAGSLDGVTVVEVGPGPGGLTRALLMEGAARVVAVERDDRCLAALTEVAAHYDNRLFVHAGDALRTNWRALLQSSGASADGKTMIIANLPYGAATMMLIDWLEIEPWPPWWHKMALMFQKEVAERIVAEPGSKAYGRLSVIAQWRTVPRIAMTLPPAAFSPAPKVSSAVVVFDPKPHPEPACSVQALGQVTAAAFGQRRTPVRQSRHRPHTPRRRTVDPRLRWPRRSVRSDPITKPRSSARAS